MHESDASAGFKAAAEPSLKEDLRASVKAAFANPGLALAQGTPVDLQKHVAAAAVLHPVIASLAAGPTNPTVAAEGAKPLTVAVTAAADGAAVADAAAPADPEGGVTLEEAKSLVRKAWAKLPEAFPDAFLVDGEPVAFLSSTYDTQLWIHRNEKLKQVRSRLKLHACNSAPSREADLAPRPQASTGAMLRRTAR